MNELQTMSSRELQSLWKCGDAIAGLNVERLTHTDLRRNLLSAVIACEGIRCKMARGQMVRRMAENKPEDRSNLRAFDQLDYRFHGELSGENHLAFFGRPERSA